MYSDQLNISGGFIFNIFSMILKMSFVFLIISVLLLVSYYIIFEKCGKKGWQSLIPIYNMLIIMDIVDLPRWNILLYLIPFVNIYIMFKVSIALAKRMGKDTGFGICLAIFPIICYPILAFSKSKPIENNEGNQNNFAEQNNSFNNPTESMNSMPGIPSIEPNNTNNIPTFNQDANSNINTAVFNNENNANAFSSNSNNQVGQNMPSANAFGQIPNNNINVQNSNPVSSMNAFNQKPNLENIDNLQQQNSNAFNQNSNIDNQPNLGSSLPTSNNTNVNTNAFNQVPDNSQQNNNM